MTTRIKLRRDTAANWTANNPILAAGEPGLETDTGKTKYGDGTTQWVDLGYASGITPRAQVGSFIGYAESIPNYSNYDYWFDSVIADPAGNAYYVGSQNNTYWPTIVKVNPEGELVWQKEITWADGYEGWGISAAYNTATDRLYVVGYAARNYQQNLNDGGTAVYVINPTNGTLVGNPTVLRDDVTNDGSQASWLNPVDIMLTSSGDPVVAGEKSGNATFYAVTSATGSTVNVLFVDSAQFVSNTGNYPLAYSSWFITGTNITSANSIIGVNRYDNQSTINIASTGTGATFNVNWAMKGSQVFFPDYPTYFGVVTQQSGNGYNPGDTLALPASSYGGATTGTITVLSVNGSGSITDWAFTGTFNTSVIKLTTDQGVNFGTTGTWQVQDRNSQGFLWTPSWGATFGSSEWDKVNAVARDSTGNIYAAMQTYDRSVNNGQTRGQLVKVSSTGSFVWSRNFDPVGYDYWNDGYTGVAVDSNDTIIIAQDEQITKVDRNGNILWQRQIEPNQPFDTWNACVDVDSDDNIYYVAEYSYMGQPTSDAFLIIKFNINGDVVWQREAGATTINNTQWNDGYQIITVQGNRFYVAASTYQGGDDIGFGMNFPTDGSGATNNTTGKYFYNTTTWTIVNTTGTVDVMEIDFRASNFTVYTTNTFAVNTLTNVSKTESVRTGDIDGRIENLYSLSFEDGTVQKTAYTSGISESGNSPFIYNNNDYYPTLSDAGKFIRWRSSGWSSSIQIYIPNNNDVPFPIGTQLHFIKEQGINSFMFWNGTNGNDGDITIIPSSPNYDAGMQNNMYNSGEGWSVRHPDYNQVPAHITLTKIDTNRWLLECSSPSHVMDWSW